MPDSPPDRTPGSGDEAAPDLGRSPVRPNQAMESDQAMASSPPKNHEATGLDLARTTAAAMRGFAKRGLRTDSNRARRAKTIQLSGAHPDGRDPMLLGAAVDQMVTANGWSADVAVRAVFARWPEIVGSDVAAHCKPTSYQDGNLAIRTESTAWATQLQLLAPHVVRRMNDELGDGTVLRIDVQGPEAPSWRRGPRSIRGARGPRDTYG